MIHTIEVSPRYLYGEQLPRSVSVDRWQAGSAVFMNRHHPVGTRPRTLGRPDLAGSYLRDALVAVPHSAMYALFLCKDHVVVSALEIARGDQTTGDLSVTEREMRIRRREVVKIATQFFAAGLMLVMHEVKPMGRDNKSVAAAFHSMLVEPLAMIDVQFTDHYWITESEVRSWFASDLRDYLPAL
ncbi:hypothetical protein [Burkholderia anthina]|uniref:hypothetical protein n=1 Tax=Burkholderia anthina TaxID=179879 RepID=UPI0037BEA40A